VGVDATGVHPSGQCSIGLDRQDHCFIEKENEVVREMREFLGK
jgi:hypothetical protein